MQGAGKLRYSFISSSLSREVETALVIISLAHQCTLSRTETQAGRESNILSSAQVPSGRAESSWAGHQQYLHRDYLHFTEKQNTQQKSRSLHTLTQWGLRGHQCSIRVQAKTQYFLYCTFILKQDQALHQPQIERLGVCLWIVRKQYRWKTVEDRLDSWARLADQVFPS